MKLLLASTFLVAFLATFQSGSSAYGSRIMKRAAKEGINDFIRKINGELSLMTSSLKEYNDKNANQNKSKGSNIELRGQPIAAEQSTNAADPDAFKKDVEQVKTLLKEFDNRNKAVTASALYSADLDQLKTKLDKVIERNANKNEAVFFNADLRQLINKLKENAPKDDNAVKDSLDKMSVVLKDFDARIPDKITV